jgi:hypothetical protein
LISVRSEVQIFPGPPAFSCGAGFGSESREAKAATPEHRRRRAIVSRIGAIAQLGERVLCKHDVVGSIPSGSTIFVGAGAPVPGAGRQRRRIGAPPAPKIISVIEKEIQFPARAYAPLVVYMIL